MKVVNSRNDSGQNSVYFAEMILTLPTLFISSRNLDKLIISNACPDIEEAMSSFIVSASIRGL